ncbi:RING-type zinc-finger domain-containing protein [Elsinoe fawcettii]|nr:RING-type zinc-finger domain-containing protein [Elsinoe fawcettii]
MSSNAPSTLNSKSNTLTKSGNTTNLQSPSHSAANAYFSTQGLGQQRSGGSGSFGAGAAAKGSSTARNNQSVKSKHKQSRRFRLADEDAFAESAAMHNASSRKGQTSITHLMNFSLPPRPQQQPQNRFNNSRGVRRNPTWGLGSGYHAVDKARYVHANYRFIVDPRGEYKSQAIDADIHLDWTKILQILVSSQSQQASCPICLGTPTAPRMAKCGHIFCLPCLIRYMHSEDESVRPGEKRARWKKCPICHDAVYTTETRPVRMYQGEEGEPPREGMDVVLRLVRRKAGSTLAVPRESPDPIAKGDDIPWYFAAEVMDYARIMKGSEDYMLEQFDFDIAAIKLLEQEDELMFGEDTEWTSRAIRILNEAKEKMKGLGNPPEIPRKPEEPKIKKPPIEFNTDESNVPDMYNMQQAARSGQSIAHGNVAGIPAASTGEATPSTTYGVSTTESLLSTRLSDFKAKQHAERAPDQYLFYQALLHYYLSPLDIRILKDAFGTYESFPSSILPRIERVSTGHIVDDDLRRRIKYLSHLPYGCEVGFLECDWTDTVPPLVLEKYKPELDRRKKRYTDKEAREEKERIRAERAGDREFAAARRRRVHTETQKFQEGDFQPLVGSAASQSNISSNLDGELTDGNAASPPWTSRPNGAGFASLASPGTSPNASRTVWGTAAVPLTSPELRALEHARQEPVDDGWLQDWEKDLLKEEEELVARTAAQSLESSKSTEGGKGKKKNKKITLMSTTARRGA